MAVHVKASTILIDKFMSIFAGRGSKFWARAVKAAHYRDSIIVKGERVTVCQVCKSRLKLQVHHIEGWKHNRFLRFVLSNLITLCYACHNSYHVEFMGGYRVRADGVSFLKWRRKRKRELKK